MSYDGFFKLNIWLNKSINPVNAIIPVTVTEMAHGVRY
jgi:hypothetical protein